MTAVGLRSGEVAGAAGVHRETLRYYERRGIIAEPQRTLGGHRLYPPETVTTLRVIKAAQRLGFTLREIEDLLALGIHHHGRRHRAGQGLREHADQGLREHAAAKLSEVEQKITDLTVIADTLRKAITAGCDDLVECAADSRCPIPFADLAVTGDLGA